jgi:DNA-nicking Smr family endonuclease
LKWTIALKKQMDRARHDRATAANTEAGPIAPSYLAVLDLHEYTKAGATEKLRAKIGELKPLKDCKHLMVITGKGQHGEYACIKAHVRQLLDGAWQASYVVKRAGDGEGTDGFYVKITKKLKKHVKNAKDSQLSPTRPAVVVL